MGPGGTGEVIGAMIEAPSHPHDVASASCGIAVMAKASMPGRTKTRLVPPLTYEEAAAFNTAFLKDVAANIIAAAREAEIAGYMAFGPPGSEPFFRDNLPPSHRIDRSLASGFRRLPVHARSTGCSDIHGAAVVLNSDSPTLPTSLLVETARMLARPGDRAVIGPSTDGGYYLLGIKARHRGICSNASPGAPST